MRLRAFLIIILLLVGRAHAQTGTPAPATATAPPPPPGPPPPIPPPDYIDDDNDFDEADDLPESTGYPPPPVPPASPSQAPSTLPGRNLPVPANDTATTASKPSGGAIHFRVVQGDFWEKGKKRERGHLDQ